MPCTSARFSFTTLLAAALAVSSAAALHAQNAELVLFPNVGHNPHLEVPGPFNAELIRFLATDPDERSGEGR